MKIIRVAYRPIQECDTPGHLEEGEIIDFHKGIIKGYRRIEIEKQIDECPRCYENFLTIKDNLKEKKS